MNLSFTHVGSFVSYRCIEASNLILIYLARGYECNIFEKIQVCIRSNRTETNKRTLINDNLEKLFNHSIFGELRK